MAAIVNIKINGLAPLQNRLNNVVTTEKVERALDRGAMYVEKDAKRLVRVDTGRLRASINSIKPRPLMRMIGTNVKYAAAQEFGRPDLASYGYTPYLRPAARKNRPRILRELKQAVAK